MTDADDLNRRIAATVRAVLERLRVVQIDHRTWRFCWPDGTPLDGDPIHFDVPDFVGLFSAGRTYDTGDVVVHQGSSWIALGETSLSPDEQGPGAKRWALLAKRGRDAREGKRAPRDR